jgi:hypothetical protein
MTATPGTGSISAWRQPSRRWQGRSALRLCKGQTASSAQIRARNPRVTTTDTRVGVVDNRAARLARTTNSVTSRAVKEREGEPC